MLQSGIAGSLMSLGAIDFGILVDSSVIMVENSVRHLSENHAGPIGDDVIHDACVEVRTPTMFGELIIMIVYLPILTLEAVEGKLFRPMALDRVVCLAGLADLVADADAGPGRPAASQADPREREPWARADCQRLYRPVLELGLRHRLAVLGLAVAHLAVAGLLGSELGTEFIPRLGEHSIVIASVAAGQRLAGRVGPLRHADRKNAAEANFPTKSSTSGPAPARPKWPPIRWAGTRATCSSRSPRVSHWKRAKNQESGRAR